ncbi:MAG: ATPase, T2SS/T4P/T4SS family [Methylobacter sp.]|nr:ATPase, T2SS/T4P/T4SS family [Methylococcales bacterium]MDD5112489.1 ATPase, T2SS/T4P/T4SS family [Methylobacter sp.]
MPEITRSRIGIDTYLAPSGSLADTLILKALETAVENCIAASETRLIIDFVHVPTVSSQVLDLLLNWRTLLLEKGGTLTIVNANAIILDVFNITEVIKYIHIVNRDNLGAATPLQPTSVPLQHQRLGDMLVAENLVTLDKIDKAYQLQSSTGKRLGAILIEKGWVSEIDLLKVLGKQLGIPYIYLRQGLWDPSTVKLIDKDICQRLKVLPLFKVNKRLFIATSDPQDLRALDEIKHRTGLAIKPVLAKNEDIVRQFNDSSSADNLNVADYLSDLEEDFEVVASQISEDYATIDELSSGSPVINLINALIQRAIRDGASDIHIEPARKKSRIRFRIDGVLYEVMNPSIDMYPALISRLKVMANLDISERRLPQDGRIQVNTQGRVVDLRFSSLPGIFGEKIVLRVLDKNKSLLDIDKLDMSLENQASFIRLLKRSHGLILVTGPTGSGKTTTLYAAINYLNSIEKSIVTIEDPVEYQVDIVNQNQVKDMIGLTFAKILKHVLRQDPDIVMIGEIREKETAEIAVQAALTGHLVLSTLHTNESTGAIARLIEMGVEPYLLSSSLIGVIAQRLVRTICQECKTSYVAGPEEINKYGWQDKGQVRLLKGRGCPICYDSGYKGRMATHEILNVNSGLQKLMVTSPSQDELANYVKLTGMKTLFDDGMERVLQGKTTIEEVSRVVSYE